MKKKINADTVEAWVLFALILVCTWMAGYGFGFRAALDRSLGG